MDKNGRHFDAWIVTESEAAKAWPERPWKTLAPGNLPWDDDASYILPQLPDSDLAAWIEAEIAAAQRLLSKFSAIAENDKRLLKERPPRSPHIADELMERNAMWLLRFEEYIETCHARRRAAAN